MLQTIFRGVSTINKGVGQDVPEPLARIFLGLFVLFIILLSFLVRRELQKDAFNERERKKRLK